MKNIFNFFSSTLDKSKKDVHNSNPSLLTEQDSSLKIRIQRTDKCEHRQFRELNKHSKKLTNVRALKEKPKDES